MTGLLVAASSSGGAATIPAGRAAPAAGCPYTFLSDMPFGAYCVYRGVPTLEGTPACDDDLVVIWSTHAGDETDAAARRTRAVYFGFVEAPSFLVRAAASKRALARLLDYRGDPQGPAIPLDGLAFLGDASAPRGSSVLTVTLPVPLSLADGDVTCAFDAYRGQFVGVLDVVERAPDVLGVR
jgi:hypothetical protein